MRKRMMPIFGLMLLAVGAPAQEYTTESLADIRTKVESNEVVLLDVREQKEWDRGYIQHAKRIATSEFRDESRRDAAVAKLDKKKPIYCHCAKGGRAMVISKLLNGMGFDVHPIRQDYEDIVAAGFAEVSPPSAAAKN